MKVQKTKNEALAQAVTQALKENDGYCPCKFDKTDDNKCICKEFIESTEIGPCFCGLYEKVEV